MQNELSEKREQQLKKYTAFLADRLALALTFLYAIDDAVDPFRAKDAAEYSDADWIIAGLAMLGKSQVFAEYQSAYPPATETYEIIKAVRSGAVLDIRETDVYRECLASVRHMIRRYNDDITRRADAARSTKSGLPGSGSREVESPRPR